MEVARMVDFRCGNDRILTSENVPELKDSPLESRHLNSEIQRLTMLR